MTVLPLVRILATDFLFCLYLCVFLLQFVCNAVVELGQIHYERMTLDRDVDPTSARTSS